jgi:hypothetical protein
MQLRLQVPRQALGGPCGRHKLLGLRVCGTERKLLFWTRRLLQAICWHASSTYDAHNALCWTTASQAAHFCPGHRNCPVCECTPNLSAAAGNRRASSAAQPRQPQTTQTQPSQGASHTGHGKQQVWRLTPSQAAAQVTRGAASASTASATPQGMPLRYQRLRHASEGAADTAKYIIAHLLQVLQGGAACSGRQPGHSSGMP